MKMKKNTAVLAKTETSIEFDKNGGETFLPSEQMENIFSEPLQMNFSEPSSMNNLLRFQRRLISCVRRHRQLYDPKHELFADIASKEKIWIKIAQKLKTDVEKCKNTWTDLRYEYQNYVRRLRKFLLYRNTERKRRPIMTLELELLFLWRYIPQRSRAPHPFIKRKAKEVIGSDDDDDIVIVDEEPVVIVLDDEEKTIPEIPAITFKITPEMRKLIELIKSYPELYDYENRYFNDFRRKGIIWNAIANESNDKATKLMKLWIQLQTRYEWELAKNRSPVNYPEHDIRHIMSFLGRYILKNPNTVYKQSLYLKHIWHEPIDHFKNIYSLIGTLKRFPGVVRETELQIASPDKNSAYLTAWSDIAKFRTDITPGQFEATWLILRSFYWELMNMRKQSYQLQDKWYFESIITELYASVLPKPIEISSQKVITPSSNVTSIQTTSKKNTTIIWPTLPITTATATTTTSITLTTINPISSPVNVVANKPISASTYVPISFPQAISTPPPSQEMVLPKIVSAKSLAPIANANQKKNIAAPKGLQIMQVMPANAMTIVPNNGNMLSNQKDAPKTTSFVTLTQKPATMSKSLQKIRPVKPPQLSGPYPLPKISSVHTIGGSPHGGQILVQPVMKAPVSSTSNVVSSSLPILTQAGSTSLPAVTPAPLPISNLPQMPQLAQLPRVPQLPQLSQLHQLTPMITTTTAATTTTATTPILTLRPAKETNSQTTITLQTPITQPSIRPTLSVASITTPRLPNLTIRRTPTPPTGSLQSQKTLSAPQTLQNLSRNEIMIELISTPSGNQLLVHGPPLAERFNMSMQDTAIFIREVMALPLLHNKSYAQSSRVQAYWVFLASKFNMPAHVCRAVWNFLSENFNHFSQIAPMEQLMKPFKTEAKAWLEGNELFKKFYENISKKGWLKHEQKLPALMEKIGKQRVLYQDLSRKNNVIRNSNNKKIIDIWKKLRTQFNIGDIEEIWTAFKNVFWQYMHELEMGYENHWPLRIWRPLSKLDFLIRQRYHAMEPFYYIVRNKFNEEVEKCTALEEKVNWKLPTFSLNTTNTPCSYEIDAYNLLASIRRHSDIYLLSTTAQKERAWFSVAEELKTSVSACRLTFQRAFKNYRIYMVRDPASRCRVNHRYYKHMHTIYRAVKSSQKISIKTPNELNQSVTDAPDPNDVIFPERMIFDITMDNCSPSLVMKNWAYGIGNCTPAVQMNLPEKIHALFAQFKDRQNENSDN